MVTPYDHPSAGFVGSPDDRSERVHDLTLGGGTPSDCAIGKHRSQQLLLDPLPIQRSGLVIVRYAVGRREVACQKRRVSSPLYTVKHARKVASGANHARSAIPFPLAVTAHLSVPACHLFRVKSMRAQSQLLVSRVEQLGVRLDQRLHVHSVGARDQRGSRLATFFVEPLQDFPLQRPSVEVTATGYRLEEALDRLEVQVWLLCITCPQPAPRGCARQLCLGTRDRRCRVAGGLFFALAGGPYYPPPGLEAAVRWQSRFVSFGCRNLKP